MQMRSGACLQRTTQWRCARRGLIAFPSNRKAGISVTAHCDRINVISKVRSATQMGHRNALGVPVDAPGTDSEAGASPKLRYLYGLGTEHVNFYLNGWLSKYRQID